MHCDGIDIGAVFSHEGEKSFYDGIETCYDSEVAGSIEDDVEGDACVVLAFPALFGEASDARGAIFGSA